METLARLSVQLGNEEAALGALWPAWVWAPANGTVSSTAAIAKLMVWILMMIPVFVVIFYCGFIYLLTTRNPALLTYAIFR
jgi:hypothetical protein